MVSGWGTISSGGAISNTLKYVKVPPVSDATCNAAASYAGSIVSDQMICAGQNITQVYGPASYLLYVTRSGSWRQGRLSG